MSSGPNRVVKMPSLFDFDGDRDDEEMPYGYSDVLRIGPGKARISFDYRCPVCGDRARTPDLVSNAIDFEGKSCQYDNADSRWVEWHECPCCGEWYSLFCGN